jgi:hypothetical protein
MYVSVFVVISAIFLAAAIVRSKRIA